ncbi:MAG: UDP-N-acetylmuramoyl-tripeptide--D-alanyl-D-alanine ligase [Cytophagaceae bacterium]|jgi:UDP-N-acetylmuramoyl-tripeptide--D-alanyl-D-alanine ligase|nr:UDP-N-acetylmuramoyl-tripeptide--D-alanyl-D-alanine ligase [Cytophagaceae bacterium]
MTIEELYPLYLASTGVNTDTRTVKSGQIFFALKGPNFNANDFAAKALEAGASYAVIDDSTYALTEQYIVVEDTLVALQQLALHHRRQFDVPFIAITGSNGKTTTKELMHAVLSKKYKTYCTQGNLNNHIGIPLTLLSVAKGTEMVIVEMGANHQKEIESYCTIVEPTHGLITNMGKAHLEGFGGIEGVKKGKGELYRYLKATGGTAFVRSEDEVLKKECTVDKVIYYGSRGDYSWTELVQEVPVIIYTDEKERKVKTHFNGVYNFYNMEAAQCVGKYFGVPLGLCDEAIENYIPKNNRSQHLVMGTNIILLDAYNANPSSMRAALTNFTKQEAKHKVVILGDMLELGDETKQEHEELGKWLSEQGYDKVILCGKNMQYAAALDPKFIYYPDPELLLKDFDWDKIKHAHVFIKGSRGMKLERVLDC